MTKERDYFFDNVKAVLMFLVVLGHLLLPIHGESFLVVVKRLIYVFHMPMFVFVSGYFAKTFYKNGPVQLPETSVSGKGIPGLCCGDSARICHQWYQAFSQINPFFAKQDAALVSVCNDRMVPLRPGVHGRLGALFWDCHWCCAWARFFRKLGFCCLSR